MTEDKRFNLAFYDKYDGTFSIQDKLYWEENKHLHSLDEIIDLLNELNDKCEFLEIENESLEDGATKYAELYHKVLKENEELKQFKEDVFTKIDMHLRMLPTAVDNEFNEEDGDPSLYTGAIYMLETLKKELQRDDL